jgi:trehalose/maltose hydrolase-like predicted phosphorylase
MGKPHLAAIDYQIIPENWSGPVTIRSGIDGSVTNAGVARYRQLGGRHLEVLNRGPVSPEGIWLRARTLQSRTEVTEASRTRVFRADTALEAERRIIEDEPGEIFEEIVTNAESGIPLRIEKVVSLYTSRDRGITESSLEARLALGRAGSFADLLAEHRRAWDALWARHDVEIVPAHDGEEMRREQRVVRLHVFHLLQTLSPNTIGLDVGTPARGLHGEAYRGHVFWDELVVLPLLNFHDPAITRSLLLYRYHRLEAARSLARAAGYRGAMYPWQSSSNGREATQELHLNPLSGHWNPDHSHLQRHVNAAIVFNVWQYWQATGDRGCLERYGAEMIIEIARFWSSLASRNEETGRYDITGVMGPDEYHEQYPEAESGGLRNNSYTNVMAVWCLLRALDVLALVSDQRRRELLSNLEVDADELNRWSDLTKRMTIPMLDPGVGVIEQFEGYAQLEELDWDDYRRRYGDIARLDRILRAEGKSPNVYQVSKQADVNMIFNLLPPAEVRDLFERLGYSLPADFLEQNIRWYRPRTSNGSTLSGVVFASVIKHIDCEESCRLFLESLYSDVDDLNGGTTREGIHLGAMAGTVAILFEDYAGVRLTSSGVEIDPDLPKRLKQIRFRVHYRGKWIAVEVTAEALRITADGGNAEEVPVRIGGVWSRVSAGETIEHR